MSSKINTIHITNFKAISDQEINLNGATAIVLGKNNSGKTSLLRGMIDRIIGETPGIVVKNGETEGSGELTLTTGEKFEWKFDVKGKDKLTLTTKEGLTLPVTRAIANRFFKAAFNIDEFLSSGPQKQ